MAPCLELQFPERYSPSKLESLGQECYAQERYPEALAFYNAAAISGTSLQLLDLRIAVNKKLGNLQAALKDAREMLTIDPLHGPGYLHIGEVLQRMGDHKKALAVYDKGLARASPSDESTDVVLQALKKARQVLAKRLAPAQLGDPATALPLEVFGTIFHFVRFKHICKSLRVSKTWNQNLKAYPRLWKIIDFEHVGRHVRAVSQNSVMSYIGNSKGCVTKLQLQKIPLSGTSLLRNAIARCQKLEELHILYGGTITKPLSQALPYFTANLRVLELNSQVAIDGRLLKNILNECVNLSNVSCGFVGMDHMVDTSWECKDFPRLRSYDIKLRGSRVHAQMLSVVVPPASGLRKLRLTTDKNEDLCLMLVHRDLDGLMPVLEHLCFDGIVVGDNMYRALNPQTTELHMNLPRSLRKLELINSTVFAVARGPSRMRIDPNTELPNLAELVVKESTYEIDVYALDNFLINSSPPNSKLLATFISNVEFEDSVQLSTFLSHPRLKKLKRLVLSPCQSFNDDVAEFVASTMPDLETINVSQSAITGIGIKALVLSCSNIHAICARSCPEVSWDIQAWVKKERAGKVTVSIS